MWVCFYWMQLAFSGAQFPKSILNRAFELMVYQIGYDNVPARQLLETLRERYRAPSNGNHIM